MIATVHTLVKDRTCRDCRENEFQAEPNQPGCNPAAECGIGEKVSKVATRESDLECSACDTNTFQIESDHRLVACAAQPFCTAGQQISPDSVIAQRTCSSCPEGKYASLNEHRGVCQAHDVLACPESTFMENKGSITLAQECVACPAGTDQPTPSHAETGCTTLTKISATDLNRLGYPARDLRVLGFAPQELLNGNYTRNEVVECGYAASDLRDAGFNAGEMNKDYSAGNMYEAGFTREEVVEHFELDAILKAGYTTTATTTTTTESSTTTTGTSTTTTATNTTTTTASSTTVSSTTTTSTTLPYLESGVQRRVYEDPCLPGEYWNTAAFKGVGGCYPCPSGSFANTTDTDLERTGNSMYTCPGKCDEGFISNPGSATKADCKIGFRVQWNAVHPDACAGKNAIASNPTNGWPNEGFAYITTRDECESAARILAAAAGDAKQGISQTSITDPCPDVQVSSKELAFSACQAAYADNLAACPPNGLAPINADGVVEAAALDRCVVDFGSSDIKDPAVCTVCNRTCNLCSNKVVSDDSQTYKNAPVGFCGVETGSNQEQRLVFYTPDDGAQPRHFYTGEPFTAICKVVLCNYLEEIGGTGAKLMLWENEASRDGPQPVVDDAQCIPNPLQFGEWETAEAAAYRAFYFAAAVLVGTILGIVLFYLNRSTETTKRVERTDPGEANYEADDGRLATNTTYTSTDEALGGAVAGAATVGVTATATAAVVGATPAKKESKLYDYEKLDENKIQLRLFKAVCAILIAIRAFDFMSDWAFYALAVNTPRFEYIIEHQGLSFKTFKNFALAFNVLSTFFWFPDLFGFYERHQAILNKCVPPTSSFVITIIVLLVEDVPQFLLNVVYMGVVNNEAYGNPTIDPVAIFSLMMSIMGMILNLTMVVKPGWFFDMVDKETGEALPEMEDKMGTFVKMMGRRASMRQGASVRNPLFFEGKGQPAGDGDEDTVVATGAGGYDNAAALIGINDGNSEYETVAEEYGGGDTNTGAYIAVDGAVDDDDGGNVDNGDEGDEDEDKHEEDEDADEDGEDDDEVDDGDGYLEVHGAEGTLSPSSGAAALPSMDEYLEVQGSAEQNVDVDVVIEPEEVPEPEPELGLEPELAAEGGVPPIPPKKKKGKKAATTPSELEPVNETNGFGEVQQAPSPSLSPEPEPELVRVFEEAPPVPAKKKEKKKKTTAVLTAAATAHPEPGPVNVDGGEDYGALPAKEKSREQEPKPERVEEEVPPPVPAKKNAAATAATSQVPDPVTALTHIAEGGNGVVVSNLCLLKTSKGPCMQPVAAGSKRCLSHTCTRTGCFSGKSSKAKFCKKHTTAKPAKAKPAAEVFEGFGNANQGIAL